MTSVLLKHALTDAEPNRIEHLVVQIARLVRHRGFVRDKVVSALLLKHLPMDAGYAWSGEAALHARLVKAALDPTTLNHLIASARLEIEMIHDRD